jgi:protein-L-isoaspartate(D-aspartate) O-methyltransferase
MPDRAVQADYRQQREAMVAQQIAARGVRDPLVLEAMRRVPREVFLPPELREFAYEDAPLPIAEGQTISQPYIVAYMTEALGLRGGEKVLEVGTGSGYAAAVVAEIAGEVYTIERHRPLAERAGRLLAELGYGNVEVRHGDGTKGWPEAAPFDAILVAAGGPEVPRSLREQLAIGGRLVIPVGPSVELQRLVRVTRTGPGDYRQEELAGVRFVPLIGAEGWEDTSDAGSTPRARRSAAVAESALPALVAGAAEPLAGADADADELAPLLDRIGEARVVLIGEATHGTSEFYRFRARLTRELIERRGFTIVAAEADWPDASRIDHYVRHRDAPPAAWQAFSRFPTWMWRNREVREFVDWLHERNATISEPRRRAGFYGLDLYSLFTSIDAVLRYLDDVDPEAARVARARYGCLTPWQADPATYGRAALSGRYRECESEVVTMLADLLAKRLDYAARDGERFVDAVQNARLVANAERYYRIMYYGASESWNLRDTHMFETLQLLLAVRGAGSRAVVWAHNSHVGDASATDMAARGQLNVGQLCRQELGDGAYIVGFGTHTGTVAAARDWDEPMEVKRVRPSLRGSYERLCHDGELPAFLLPLRQGAADAEVRERLSEPRLERAIGVVYRPESELQSHYFRARLPRQFDEYVWFDTTRAVTPLATAELSGVPDTYPFGL